MPPVIWYPSSVHLPFIWVLAQVTSRDTDTETEITRRLRVFGEDDDNMFCCVLWMCLHLHNMRSNEVQYRFIETCVGVFYESSIVLRGEFVVLLFIYNI